MFFIINLYFMTAADTADVRKEAENLERQYIAIDLKSFYASVECVDLGMDPLRTNLVVADASRTEKTICLAVTPGLKSHGIPGRARLFEIIQRVRVINAQRRIRIPGREFSGKSVDSIELEKKPELELDYITAPPRMARYVEVSTQIYNIYLRYAAPEDIHVYSIDEVFINASDYMALYGMTAREMAMKMIRDVLKETGITATVGIGTNMYLCKIAMDIEAKKMPADRDGVRIAELDEMSYRYRLWNHRPIRDFWRIGPGYSRKLAENGMYTMGDVARRSLQDEDVLYKMFGINAELLIDHAWGYETCTMEDIKSYRSRSSSLSSGQVLTKPYVFIKGKLVLREMTELLALDMVDKGVVADQIVIAVGYDIENLKDAKRNRAYKGPVVTDHYGRRVPKGAHGSVNLGRHTSSARIMVNAVMNLYDSIADRDLLVRRLTVTANNIIRETDADKPHYEQMDLFTDYEKLDELRAAEAYELEREKKMQHTVLDIKKKYGRNAILKGMNLEEDATAVVRNGQIGGHKA